MSSEQFQGYTFGQILERATDEHLRQFSESLDITYDDNIRENIVRKLAEQNDLFKKDQETTTHEKFDEYLSMTQTQLAQIANMNGSKSQLIRYLCTEKQSSSPVVSTGNTISHPFSMEQAAARPVEKSTRIVSPRITSPLMHSVTQSLPPPNSNAKLVFKEKTFAAPCVTDNVCFAQRDRRYYHSKVTVFEDNVMLLASHEDDCDGIYVGTLNEGIIRYDLKKHCFDEMPLLNLSVDGVSRYFLLHSLVFHPNYTNNGIFYLSYCVPSTKAGVDHVARCSKFTRSSESAYLTLQSEEILVEEDYAQTLNTGGALILGPVSGGEYSLYYALGDGGVSASAQDITSYSGKMMQLFPSRRGDDVRKIVAVGLSSPDYLYLSGKGHLYIIDNYSTDSGLAGVRIMRYVKGRNYLWPAAVNDNIHIDENLFVYLSSSSLSSVYTVAPINDLILYVADGDAAVSTVLDIDGETVFSDVRGLIKSISVTTDESESKSPLVTGADGRVYELYEMNTVSNTDSQLLCHDGKLYQLIGNNLYTLSAVPLLDESDINAIMMAIMSTVQESPSVFRKSLQQTAQGIAESQLSVAPVISIYDGHSGHFIQSAAPGAWKKLEEVTNEKANLAYCYSSDSNALSTKDLTYLSEKDKPLSGICVPGFGGVPLYKADRNGQPRLVGSLAISGDSNEQNDYIAQVGSGAYAAPRQLGLPYM